MKHTMDQYSFLFLLIAMTSVAFATVDPLYSPYKDALRQGEAGLALARSNADVGTGYRKVEDTFDLADAPHRNIRDQLKRGGKFIWENCYQKKITLLPKPKKISITQIAGFVLFTAAVKGKTAFNSLLGFPAKEIGDYFRDRDFQRELDESLGSLKYPTGELAASSDGSELKFSGSSHIATFGSFSKTADEIQIKGSMLKSSVLRAEHENQSNRSHYKIILYCTK